jgi:hypothetical protein
MDDLRASGEVERFEAETLDDLLSRWHSWAQSDRVARGHANTSLVVGQCRNNGLQYESQLEQQDAHAEKLICRQVDHEVRQMNTQHQAALYCEARNLVLGLSVWSSPRLPKDPAARDMLVAEARAHLVQRLKRVGVM